MNRRQTEAVCKAMNAVGSWSHARFDQWLRYYVGDEDADEILDWFDRTAHIEFDTTDKAFKVRS